MKKKKLYRQLILEIFILVVLAAGIWFYNVVTSKRPIAPMSQTPGEQSTNVSAVSVDTRDDIRTQYGDYDPDYTNYLLVGLDVRDQSQMDFANSDTMIIASVNNVTGAVRMVSIYRDTLLNINKMAGDEQITYVRQAQEADEFVDTDSIDATAIGYYNKANAAYANGSITQLIEMVENNLDVPIDGYAVVNFSAVSEMVDDIGGIDVWMTKQEVIHMNNYCVETSSVTGKSYEPITPQEEATFYHLNGVQAVSYARIRYTAGNDMKRTQRQRVVIHKVIEKAEEETLAALKSMISNVLPNCRTSVSLIDLFGYAANLKYYTIDETTGFPFTHIEKNLSTGGHTIDPVVPVTLESNVKELHKFLFNDNEYEPTPLIHLFSEGIEQLSGLDEDNMDTAIQNSVIGNSGGEADVVQ